MNEAPSNQPSDAPESARRNDYNPTGAPTQPTGNYPPPIPPYQPQGAQPLPPPQPSYVQPVPPRRHMGTPMAGPVILIAAGVVLLLNNLDILPWGIWADLWRLWPLALIAVGLDLIIGRRRPLLSLLLILLVLGVGGAIILYAGFATRGDLTAYNLNIPLNSARSASVEIDFGLGDLNVDGSANNESLASGSLDYYANSDAPQADVNTKGDQIALMLSEFDQHGFNFGWFRPAQSPHWNIHLSPDLPTSLHADLGVGNGTLDLGNLNLTDLAIQSGTGNTSVTFPHPQGNLSATIDGGIGNLEIHIPDGVQAHLSLNTGIGNSSVDDRFIKQGDGEWVTRGYSDATDKLDLTVHAGLGSVTISK